MASQTSYQGNEEGGQRNEEDGPKGRQDTPGERQRPSRRQRRCVGCHGVGDRLPPRSIPSPCNTAARRGRMGPAKATSSKFPDWEAAIGVAPFGKPNTKVLGERVPQ